MKKYFKKFGIMFVMALILSLGFCISAFASDDGVVGTANLNNTVENSAKVGDKLISPEVGWKRYDDTNSKIKYSGSGWGVTQYSDFYDGTDRYTTILGDKIQLTFYGTKLRIIGQIHTQASDNTNITIDGQESYYSEYSSTAGSYSTQRVVYEKLNLPLGFHTVEIKATVANYMRFDAIDIDDTGYLAPYGESITLDKSSMDLNVSDTQQLTATTTPAGAQVTWTSSDNSVATVDSNGNVTGIKEGTCTITATTADGLTATCTVTVTKEEESISLNKSTTNLTTGDSETLVATTTPATIGVTWTSSDSSVATVDSTGKVTAIGTGTATITATTTDGSNLSASCIVNVASSGTTTPTEPTGDANLYIELVDGQIKQYNVSSDEINKFTEWYENRDNDHSLPATYKFTKGSYTDYVVQNQIDWFEVR